MNSDSIMADVEKAWLIHTNGLGPALAAGAPSPLLYL